MILNKKYLTVYFLLFFSSIVFSQESDRYLIDTTKVERIEEVVITGQYNPQSVNKSVFEVRVINSDEIQKRAANNLADLLNQTLNINITPNTSTGKSGVSLFGLDAQYFKILIDNVPVINEEGLGNNVDLTLINLDDIQQIEIVEGAMGVQNGSNAVSGVINIITKKSIRKKTKFSFYVQEESVGDEYEWFDKGRHIQSINLGHNFSDNFYANLVSTRNDFGGFWNGKKGEVYDKNDGLRGHSWLPKEQLNSKLLLNYKKNRFKIFYKFDYFNETIDKYNEIVDLNENPATATSNPLAIDEEYENNRFIHHINSSGFLSEKIGYNISASYQKQTKEIDKYAYEIRRDRRLSTIEKGSYLKRSAFFSRGTFSNLFSKGNFNGVQLGYELTNEKGTGSPYAITISPNEDEANQKLNNYDFFASTEIDISDKFSLRPGTRVSFSNLFDNQYAFSLSSKYQFNDGLEFRTVIGSANRTPSYDEFFTYFVDINHDVQGNPNLNPEKGLSVFAHLKKKFSLSDKVDLKSKLSASYINVNDRIELIIVAQSPLAYQFNNIDTYKSFGFFTDHILDYNNFKFQFGASVLGISKILDRTINFNDDFLYNLQLNSSLNYQLPDKNLAFTLYFKHNGKQHQFVERTNENGDQEYQKGTTKSFNWLDATVKKGFFDNKAEVTLGARNLLDISSVGTTAFSGGAHTASPRSIQLAYGRSYFLKLAYNLNI